MADTEDIETNSAGGKQSKLYVAYNLVDPWALEALSHIYHRGAIKYAPDNWRNISIEDHVNHAMHHLVQASKALTRERLNSVSPFYDDEDHLAHALCRLTFALGLEIARNGKHPEHSDPTYHEPKATSVERDTVREAEHRGGPVPATPGFDERAGSFATLTGSARRHAPKRPSQASSGKASPAPNPALRNRNRR